MLELTHQEMLASISEFVASGLRSMAPRFRTPGYWKEGQICSILQIGPPSYNWPSPRTKAGGTPLWNQIW